MAGILAPVQPEREQPREVPVVNDVTPLSLGIKVRDDEVSIQIHRNTNLPTPPVKKTYKTFEENQTSAKVEVIQGESLVASENHCLGSYVFENIPKGAAGAHKIDVTF